MTRMASLGSRNVTLHHLENLADVEGLKIEDSAVKYQNKDHGLLRFGMEMSWELTLRRFC